MNRVVQSGLLYRNFTHGELQKIQQCMTILSGQTGQWVAGRVEQIKKTDDYKEGHTLANYVEDELRKHLETVQRLKAKK